MKTPGFVILFIIFSFCAYAQDQATDKRMSKPFKKTISLKEALKDPLAAKNVEISRYEDSIFPSEDLLKLKNVEYISIRGRFVKDSKKDSARPPIRLRIDTAKLMQLSQLTCLNMQCFDFSVFPAELYAMKQLKGLSLVLCRISTVPPGISAMSGLTYLEFRLNELRSLPDDLFEMNQLETLDLTNNQFVSVPEKIPQLAALRYLYLFNIESVRAQPEGNYTWPYPYCTNKINYNAQYDLLRKIISPKHFMIAYISVPECADKAPLREKLKAEILQYSVWISTGGCD